MRKEKGKMKDRLAHLLRVSCFSFLIFHLSFLQAQEHSPTTAVCLSLLPGAGQVYNHQAWKIPIIYGAFATVGYFIHYNYQKMDMFRDEYLYRINNGTANMSDYASYPNSSIYSLYNSYNRDYQLSIIIAAGIYALNLVDAYVYGHLFNFRIDDELSMNLSPTVTPTPMGWQPTLGVQLQF